MGEYSMVYMTARDEEEGRRIASKLLTARLVACANLFPIDSMYWWKGKVEEAKEVAVVMKSRTPLVGSILREIRRLHSYETPCVVSYPMGPGLKEFLEWIRRETANP